MKKELYEARANLARALANETRLAIVDILGEKGEKCVCELTELLDVSQSSVSKHLGILKKAGIVDSKKDGLNVCYFLRTPCVVNFFTCLDGILLKDLEKRREQIKVIRGKSDD